MAIRDLHKIQGFSELLSDFNGIDKDHDGSIREAEGGEVVAHYDLDASSSLEMWELMSQVNKARETFGRKPLFDPKRIEHLKRFHRLDPAGENLDASFGGMKREIARSLIDDAGFSVVNIDRFREIVDQKAVGHDREELYQLALRAALELHQGGLEPLRITVVLEKLVQGLTPPLDSTSLTLSGAPASLRGAGLSPVAVENTLLRLSNDLKDQRGIAFEVVPDLVRAGLSDEEMIRVLTLLLKNEPQAIEELKLAASVLVRRGFSRDENRGLLLSVLGRDGFSLERYYRAVPFLIHQLENRKRREKGYDFKVANPFTAKEQWVLRRQAWNLTNRILKKFGKDADEVLSAAPWLMEKGLHPDQIAPHAEQVLATRSSEAMGLDFYGLSMVVAGVRPERARSVVEAYRRANAEINTIERIPSLMFVMRQVGWRPKEIEAVMTSLEGQAAEDRGRVLKVLPETIPGLKAGGLTAQGSASLLAHLIRFSGRMAAEACKVLPEAVASLRWDFPPEQERVSFLSYLATHSLWRTYLAYENLPAIVTSLRQRGWNTRKIIAYLSGIATREGPQTGDVFATMLVDRADLIEHP